MHTQEEYTLLRKFYAWFGFLNLLALPFTAVALYHLHALITLCLAK